MIFKLFLVMCLLQYIRTEGLMFIVLKKVIVLCHQTAPCIARRMLNIQIAGMYAVVNMLEHFSMKKIIMNV